MSADFLQSAYLHQAAHAGDGGVEEEDEFEADVLVVVEDSVVRLVAFGCRVVQPVKNGEELFEVVEPGSFCGRL